MSISSFFAEKSVAVLGTELMTGTLLLQRLLLYTPIQRIVVLLKTKSNTFDSKSQLPEHSKLFNLLGMTKEQISGRVEIVRFIENEEQVVLEKEIQHIDVIFNCYMPVELQSKAMYRHILFPRKLVKYLELKHSKSLLVVLSSIYSQDSGYVPEDNYVAKVELPDKNNVKVLDAYFSSLNMTLNETWKYSVKAFQHIYFNSSLNVCLIRVPTIGATMKVCEGYIDKFTSLTWLMYQVGLGQIRQLKGNQENIIDIIPGDYVVNFMVACSAVHKNKKEVCNLSTSTRNPLQLKYFIEILNDYWRTHKINNSKTQEVKLYEKSFPYAAIRLKNRLPHFLISKFANSLDLKALKIKTGKKLQQLDHQEEIANRFQGFLREQWLCESNKSIDIFQHLSPEEKAIFNFNLNQLVWKHYIRLNVYSIQSHLLGLDVQPYSADTIYVINKGKEYFDDIYWAFTHGKSLNFKPQKEMKRDVINSAGVKKVMARMIQEKTGKLQKSPANYAEVEKEVYGIADAICEKMFADIDMKYIKVFVWFMHKVFKQIYEQVVVDRNAIRELKSYEEKHQIPLILIPTHRSYLDFLVFPYLFFGQNIKTPMIGAADDFLNMALIHILFRKSGAFFITRNQKENRDLYLSILNQYCTEILCQNNHLKFFIQGTRSRLGKMMEPKLGLLNVVCETVTAGKINDALIVPVTINYEKVLEGASFPYELLGEAKVKESLGRLIKAVDVLKENYGQIYIEICKPISIKEYFKKKGNKTQKETVSELGYEIVHTMTDNLVITPTSLVSTVILMQRKGISEDEVKRLVNILSKDIHSRGIKIIRTQHNSTVSITSALELMGDIIVKTKKNIFEVGLSANTQGLNIFSLCYYRNTLTHVYFLQAIVLVALSSFGYEASRENGVSLDNLKARSAFLIELIKNQYVLKDNLKDASVFSRVLDSLAKREMISVHGLRIVVNSNSELVDLVSSLVWPLVESYWMTLLYLFKLHKQSLSIQYSVLLSQIQWFGETMVNQRFIEYYEAISQDTIKNALSTYSKMNLIKIVKEDIKNKGVAQFVKLSTTQDVLKDMEMQISLYLKSNFARTVRGKLQDSSKRSSVALDFPFLAKL